MTQGGGPLRSDVGRGAMGRVYAARDEEAERMVAVKVLACDFEQDPDVRAPFHREAQAAAGLHHRNVVMVYQIGEAGWRAVHR